MIKIIKVTNAHLKEYGEHLKALPKEDKINRFGTLINDYSIDQLMLNILYNPTEHQLWIASKKGRTIGWGHTAKTGSAWEIAVSVNHEEQSQGAGSALIGEMLEWAKVHEIDEVFMHCIESNKTIQHLARKFNLTTREREAGERTAALEVPEAKFYDINSQWWKEYNTLVDEFTELRRRMSKLLLGNIT